MHMIKGFLAQDQDVNVCQGGDSSKSLKLKNKAVVFVFVIAGLPKNPWGLFCQEGPSPCPKDLGFG